MIIYVFTNSSCIAVGVQANSIVKMTENEIAMYAGANYQRKNNIVTNLGIA